jgi:phosphoribosylglycinamide formyltransferase-1
MEKNTNKKIVFLCSGGGGNLRFIDIVIKQNWVHNASIVKVITDRNCQANAYATNVGIDNSIMDFSPEGQYGVLKVLNEVQPDIIVTTIHKILIDPIVSIFGGKLINLHYSLLPAFGGVIGMSPVQNAIDYGAKFTGVTAHLVTSNVDQGKPIVQVVIPTGNESLESLSSVVFKSGCLALITAVQIIQPSISKCPNKFGTLIEIENRSCFFSEISMIEIKINCDEIWTLVKGKSC